MEIFRNFWQESKFLTISIFFSKNLTEIEIFEIVDRNRCFSKILTEIEVTNQWGKQVENKKNWDEIFYWNENFEKKKKIFEIEK